ncbi:RraA family protein [Paracoccus aminovorans]|uniref:RraA family protein n=1 Tax=Paracoccus aminovorans TaxID=34004 RepID=UPI002B25779B|nr:RraA family protein [Paracoccus aminovorans]
MTPELLDLLRQVDTPTVCNAIEVAQGRRGFANFTRATMLSSAPEAGAIVGFARTAAIAALTPSTEDAAVLRQRRMAYYRHMADAPAPSIAVIEDIDGDDAVGAFWGEINTTVHKAFGLAGTVTNGVMRDLGDLPDGYPVIAGRIGPSHGFVRVESIGQPVTIFGMTVLDGDLVHADRHGALVVPADIVPDLGAAIRRLMQTERLILDPARRPGFDFDAFEQAWSEFEAART